MLFDSNSDAQLASLVTKRIKLAKTLSSGRFTAAAVIVATAAFMAVLVTIKGQSSGTDAIDMVGAVTLAAIFGPMIGLVIAVTRDGDRKRAIRDTEFAIFRLGNLPQAERDTQWVPSMAAVTDAILRLAAYEDTTDVNGKLLRFSSLSGASFNMCAAIINTDALTRWNTSLAELDALMTQYQDVHFQVLFDLLRETDPSYKSIYRAAGWEPSLGEQDADFRNLQAAARHTQCLAQTPGATEVFRTLVRDAAPVSRAGVLRLIDTSVLVVA